MAIPILKIEENLIVSIQQELHDHNAVELQQDILDELAKTESRGLLIDVTAVDVVDSFLGRMISDTATMASLMGARTVLVGLRPAVAITLVELGLELEGVHAALNMEKGLSLLKRLAVEEGRIPAHAGRKEAWEEGTK